MKTVKLFETSDMPDYLFKLIKNDPYFVKDGTSSYVVGFFLHEINTEELEYTKVKDEDTKEYFRSNKELYAKCDQWFLDRGAKHMENVLVHHGTFNEKPHYLFPRSPMTKTLVIHPFDVSTGFLEEIYSGKDWTLIDNNVSHSHLKKSIQEHDRIIMLGHGTEYGLLGYDRTIIDSQLVYLLREKECVCIWCNADVFFEKYKLKGFYTGMIISEKLEANMESVDATESEVNKSNSMFAKSIAKSIDETNMLEVALDNYKGDTDVIEFNRNRMFESK